MDSQHQEAIRLDASNYIIFHFSQKTSIKMSIQKKVNIRTSPPLTRKPPGDVLHLVLILSEMD